MERWCKRKCNFVQNLIFAPYENSSTPEKICGRRMKLHSNWWFLCSWLYIHHMVILYFTFHNIRQLLSLRLPSLPFMFQLTKVKVWHAYISSQAKIPGLRYSTRGNIFYFFFLVKKGIIKYLTKCRCTLLIKWSYVRGLEHVRGCNKYSVSK